MASLHQERLEIRKVRYRLKRQGMLELDTWLARLEPALLVGEPAVVRAIIQMLECDVPELLAVMRGECSVPITLRPWLEQ